MREKTITIYKNEGETPLEALDRFRFEQPLYKDAVLSYAGRLDPMAEGALLVLVDEENKKRLEYLEHDKTYEVEILFGMSTDTGDILGIASPCALPSPSVLPSFADFESFVGSFTQKYPIFSSKTVSGKPLFQWAREGKLGEIEIPEKTSEIYSIEFLDKYLINKQEILDQVNARIAKVKGDFRQENVLKSWEKSLENAPTEPFPVMRIRVSCSSGTYMRTLAEMIGKKAGFPALAWKIKRLLISPK